jgi:alanyl-tRNA synthetase
MTERLYYQDPGLTRFEAVLLRQEERESGGARWWLAVLDRTAFYPEGGGQPADHGSLGGLPVLDVQEQQEEVLHLLPEPLPIQPGAAVAGQVDPERRQDFRQQHTGQHLISSALLAAAGLATVSANLGEEYTSVEIASLAVEEARLAAAERRANRTVNENHPVRIHWVDAEEARRFPLRKPPPPGKDRLRIVEIPGIDASACGGLHVASTGEVGLVRFAYAEKIRGRLRLHWKIGERAWSELRERDQILAELARELTCGVPELASSVRALKARLRSQELAGAQAEKRLAALLAERLLAAAETFGQVRLVRHRLEGESPGLMQELFQALAAAPRTVACLAGETGTELRWLVGTSGDLDLPLERIVPPLLPLIQGKGGGRGRRFQGTGRRREGWAEFCAGVARALAKPDHD